MQPELNWRDKQQGALQTAHADRPHDADRPRCHDSRITGAAPAPQRGVPITQSAADSDSNTPGCKAPAAHFAGSASSVLFSASKVARLHSA